MLDEMSWPSSSILWTTKTWPPPPPIFFSCYTLCFSIMDALVCAFVIQNHGKISSIFLGYFINHKPLFSEECSYEFQIHHYYLTSCVNYHHSQKCFAIFFGKYYMWYLISHTSLIIGIMWEELHDKP